MNMFKDDSTKQISLARILCAIIVVYCMVSMYSKDIPLGWCGLVTALYFANKGSSTVKEIQLSDKQK
jgi:hypothetical protein